MDRQDVITVLDSLVNGVDPATGAPVPAGPLQSPATVNALAAASAFLKAASLRRPRNESSTLSSAGLPWSAEEDSNLAREFDSGMSIAQIALQHQRTSGGITARLVKLGRIDPATVKTRNRGVRVASSS